MSHKVRNPQGESRFNLFVSSKELATAYRFVIDNVKNLALDAGHQPCQNNRFGAIVHKRQRKWIAPTQVNEKPKRINSHSTTQTLITWAKNGSWSQNYVRETPLFAVMLY